RHPDDRQGAVGRILQQPRLAGRRGSCSRAGRGIGGPASRGTAFPRAGACGVMPARRTGWFGPGILMLGFAFLYAPIVLLVLYSFNASRLVTVWAGFSPRWYGALLHDEAFAAAALTSLEVAAVAATLSLVLGTFAGFSMARFARFPGRLVFGFALLAPLVVPEVILGPSATTLPMAVFSSVRLGVSPEVNALATLFLALVFLLVALAGWLMARQERR